MQEITSVPPFKNTYLVIWGRLPQSHWPGPHKDSFSYTPGWWQWTCPGWRSAADVLSWTVDCSYKRWCFTGQEMKSEAHSHNVSFDTYLDFLLLRKTKKLVEGYINNLYCHSTCPPPCLDRCWGHHQPLPRRRGCFRWSSRHSPEVAPQAHKPCRGSVTRHWNTRSP